MLFIHTITHCPVPTQTEATICMFALPKNYSDILDKTLLADLQPNPFVLWFEAYNFTLEEVHLKFFSLNLTQFFGAAFLLNTFE